MANTQQRNRPLPFDLSHFTSLVSRLDVRWVSLQYGDYNELERQAADAGAPILIDHSVDQLLDIDVFAAPIAAMDFVTTIDKSTANLAGAIGVPVWVLPYGRDWR